MTFRADPEALKAFATAMQTLSNGTTVADEYRANHMSATQEESGLFAVFIGSLDTLNNTIDDNICFARRNSTACRVAVSTHSSARCTI